MKVGSRILVVWAMLIGFVAAAEPAPPDYAKFEVLKELGVRPGGCGVAFSPDGKVLITADENLNLWDLEKKTLIRSLPKTSGRLWRPAVTPDGKFAVALTRPHSSVFVWDLDTGKQLHEIAGDGGNLALSPDGATFVSGNSMYDLKTGKNLLKFTEPEHDFVPSIREEVVFAKDGKTCWSLRRSGVFAQWDISTGQPSKPVRVTQGAVTCMVIAPGGDGCVLSNGLGEVIRLDSAGKRLRELPKMINFVFSSDGKTLAGLWGQEIILCNVETGETIRKLPHWPYRIECLAFSPDGKKIAATDADSRMAVVWDTESGNKIAEFACHNDRGIVLAFCPDGKTFLSGDCNQGGRMISPIIQWDLAAGSVRTVFWPESGFNPMYSASQLRVLPGGESFFSCDGRFQAGLWDMTTGKVVRKYAFPKPCRIAGFLSPDGRTVVISGYDALDGDGTLFYDRESGKEIKSLPKGGGIFLGYAPDGKAYAAYRRAAPEAKEFVVAICDATTGGERRVLSPPFKQLAFNPDGKGLASIVGRNVLELWDLDTGKTRSALALDSAKRAVSACAFSPNGKVMVTGDQLRDTRDEARIVFWNWTTGAQLGTIALPRGSSSGYVVSLAFSPDGRTLLAAVDGRILVLGEKPVEK